MDLVFTRNLIWVSTVLQDTDGQFIGLSVAEDLAFALENDMMDLGTMKERVQSWAERLDLKLDHRPQDLSVGKTASELSRCSVDAEVRSRFDEPSYLRPQVGSGYYWV